jgi:hypothetical protein
VVINERREAVRSCAGDLAQHPAGAGVGEAVGNHKVGGAGGQHQAGVALELAVGGSGGLDEGHEAGAALPQPGGVDLVREAVGPVGIG